jgi:hypothetical protein
MCIKAGQNELSSVKALMMMSLNAVVAEVFGIDLDDISPQLKVFADLHMTADQQTEFSGLVADYFDGIQVEFNPTTTLADIFEHVVAQEFVGLTEEMH